MFQAYSVNITTLDTLTIFAHIRVYFGRFRHIQNPGTVRNIDILRHIQSSWPIQAYSES